MLYTLTSDTSVLIDPLTNTSSQVKIRARSISINNGGFSIDLCYCSSQEIIAYREYTVTPEKFNEKMGENSYENIIEVSKQLLTKMIDDTSIFGLSSSNFSEAVDDEGGGV